MEPIYLFNDLLDGAHISYYSSYIFYFVELEWIIFLLHISFPLSLPEEGGQLDFLVDARFMLLIPLIRLFYIFAYLAKKTLMHLGI